MNQLKQRKSLWKILTKPFRTKQYRFTSIRSGDLSITLINVLQNESSLVIPMGVYPSYDEIDDYVKDARPAFLAIESLISTELNKYGISTTIVNNEASINNSFYIKYQDYWAWDFKRYMPVLKISMFDTLKKELITVISEGNTMGMHDYPNPKKQIPVLINLMMK